ncbi:MAG TPA: SDR family oxidoreductase, partial [Gammaproteobacteria bacterium]|nr:SDR family oxidoreductase [Gammaproteobacteria bacterium]
MNIFIIGFGDIGRRVAQLELQQGSQVAALTRTKKEPQTVHLIRGDLDQPQTLPPLPTKGVILYYFAPPAPQGTADQRMQNWLNSLTSENFPQKIIYISTTGVYGDQRGAWVDENTPPQPQTARAKRRLDAEQKLKRWSKTHAIPAVILRVAGIYSRERLPVEAVRQRRPVLHPGEAPWSNRIHADDLARVCIAASRHPTGTTIYNVTDGQVSTMTDYYHAIADTLDLPRCPEITREQAQQQLSPAMLSYLDESRRIDNRKMLEELGITLR